MFNSAFAAKIRNLALPYPMKHLNETHDQALRSWVSSANVPGNDFPIQNLPFASFKRRGIQESFRVGVAIGDMVLDMASVYTSGVLTGEVSTAVQACAEDKLNALMSLGPDAWSALRLALSRSLREGAPKCSSLRACLVPQAEVEYDLPARIGDYTDFYTSIHHAANVGKQFRAGNPLLPNYKWIPIGYHGRASSIGVSGRGIRRPSGQTMAPGAERPDFGRSERLDFELELGAFIGQGNLQHEPVRIDVAERHLFGVCLLNDWSARDIQSWEYQPLGPFLSKNFATSISPWVVTLEALAPYRCPLVRPEGDASPLPYLDDAMNRDGGAFDIQLEVGLQTLRMRNEGRPAERICRTTYRHAYWTLAQLIAHHTVNGCNLNPGDLLGTGTLSGPTAHEAGSLIELTNGGKDPLQLPNGETRTYLEDGDAVVLRGWCEAAGAARIGLGECLGHVLCL